MLGYLEKQFGERALNGDFDQIGILKAKIKEVESKLEAQRAKKAKTYDKESAKHSEDETDSD